MIFHGANLMCLYRSKSSQVKSSQAGHPDERDAAPTGLELFSQGAYVHIFLSPNPPIFA